MGCPIQSPSFDTPVEARGFRVADDDAVSAVSAAAEAPLAAGIEDEQHGCASADADDAVDGMDAADGVTAEAEAEVEAEAEAEAEEEDEKCSTSIDDESPLSLFEQNAGSAVEEDHETIFFRRDLSRIFRAGSRLKVSKV